MIVGNGIVIAVVQLGHTHLGPLSVEFEGENDVEHGARHRRHRRVGTNSPLRGLDARQAMIAVSFGRIIGIIAMAVFLAFYAYTMWHLWGMKSPHCPVPWL
jgi:hypothetical protein